MRMRIVAVVPKTSEEYEHGRNDTLAQVEHALRLLRPKAMEKDYNKCGMYDKGQCDMYSTLVRMLANVVHGTGIDEASKQKRVAYVLSMLKERVH